MKFTGITSSGEQALQNSLKVRFRADEDAPADSLTVVFPDIPNVGPITALKAANDSGTVFFDGMVDEQEQNGSTLTLSARSFAALLLDNEALPQNYSYPSLATIFERHILPYGFTGYLGKGREFSGTFQVTKGMSEWQAAAAFCRQFLGVAPRVAGRVFDASGNPPAGMLLFGGAGLPCASVMLRRKFSEEISAVYAKSDATGNYILAATDPEATALGIVRKRYLSGSPSGAAAVLAAADRAAMEILVECPGFVSAPPGAPASVSDPALGEFLNLSVAQAAYDFSVSGEISRVTLRRV